VEGKAVLCGIMGKLPLDWSYTICLMKTIMNKYYEARLRELVDDKLWTIHKNKLSIDIIYGNKGLYFTLDCNVFDTGFRDELVQIIQNELYK